MVEIRLRFFAKWQRDGVCCGVKDSVDIGEDVAADFLLQKPLNLITLTPRRPENSMPIVMTFSEQICG